MREELVKLHEDLCRIFEQAPAEEECSEKANKLYEDIANLIFSINAYLEEESEMYE